MHGPSQLKKRHLLLILGMTLFLYGFSDVRLTDIESRIIQGKYKEAQNLSEQFLSGQPQGDESLKATYYLGLSQLRLGHYNLAETTLNSLIIQPLSPELKDKVYLSLIDSYYLTGQYNEALRKTEELLKKNPRSDFLSLIYLKGAKANLKLANWEKARHLLEKIVHEFPDSLEQPLARQLLEEKQFFTVQVGAFQDRTRAERLVFELKQRGEYAYIVETLNEERQKFYRVRVGQMALFHEAKRLQSKLSKLGYPTRIFP